MKSILTLIVLLTIIFSSCDKSVKTAGCLGLGDSTAVTIKYGEKKNLCSNDSSCISFTKVVTDSRCPEDVVCIWQGAASIEIGTCDPKEGSIELGLYQSKDFDINGVTYSIKLAKLDPYPNTTHANHVGDYTATITVKRK